ncbi:hypothetical protein MRB53_023501 [Persea americana]|uniref:Uncharacterized protein n=1 Tax=Persea americana TaxID=3435 RepID=A0ACC2LAT3_PERAE|nr:hypothetical protein MRB53_023501 [Persea americana]
MKEAPSEVLRIRFRYSGKSGLENYSRGTHCRGFKTVSNRASFFGQFVREILGGSVKLDAVILISHKSLFGYALCKAL